MAGLSLVRPGAIREVGDEAAGRGPERDYNGCTQRTDCVRTVHILKDINKLILDALRRLRKAMSRRGRAGRKKKRGRKPGRRRTAARRGLTLKEKSAFVFRHRYLIVKRRENLTEEEREDL